MGFWQVCKGSKSEHFGFRGRILVLPHILVILLLILFILLLLLLLLRQVQLLLLRLLLLLLLLKLLLRLLVAHDTIAPRPQTSMIAGTETGKPIRRISHRK